MENNSIPDIFQGHKYPLWLLNNNWDIIYKNDPAKELEKSANLKELALKSPGIEDYFLCSKNLEVSPSNEEFLTFDGVTGQIQNFPEKDLRVCFFSPKSDDVSEKILSMISHELKTPMITIQAFFQLLKEGEINTQDETGKKLMDSAMKNVDRLITNFDDILAFKKSLQNSLDMVLQEVDPRRIFLSAASKTAEEHGSSIDSRIQLVMPAELPTGIGDRTALEKAIKSFFDFAWRASVSDSPLLAKITWNEGAELNQVEAEFRFEPGEHISQEILNEPETLFKPFSHIEKQGILTRTQDGVGMNLALSKELLEKSGGNCGVEFMKGGANNQVRIWLELPLGGGLEDLEAILSSRIAQRMNSDRDLSIVWVSAKMSNSSSVLLASHLKSILFRSTDAAFPLSTESRPTVVAVLEDCRIGARLRVEERLRRELIENNAEIRELKIGGASFPEEAKLVDKLFSLARQRMR